MLHRHMPYEIISTSNLQRLQKAMYIYPNSQLAFSKNLY